MNKFIFVLVISFAFLACKPDEVEKKEGPNTYTLEAPILFGKPNFLNISNNNPLTEQGIDLGRHLFYEPMLSKDYSKTCASCHKQALGFSDSQTFSVGIDGQRTERNSMAITNTAWQSTFFWDGASNTLEEQALIPLQNPKEMGMDLPELVKRLKASEFYTSKFKNAFPNQEISEITIAKALAQFEQTLVSANSRYDQYKLGKIKATDQEIRGEKLFYTHPDPNTGIRGGNCGDCHSGALTFSNSFSNNGLDDLITDKGRGLISKKISDDGKFKIPSLRNIALTGPYMHDGRFTSLEQVLDHYNEHIKQSATIDPQITEASNYNIAPGNKTLGLTKQEKADIVAFLKMLTDTEFTNNKNFSNPFVK